MSSTANNASGPPGPPPKRSGPPGPPPRRGDKVEDVTRYKQYLAKQGVQADDADLHEEESMRVGPWRFYYRGPASRRSDVTILDDAGHAVTAKSRDQWNAFLSTPGLDAEGAHKRLVWLMGRAAPVKPGHKFKDPKAAAKVAAPTLERTPDGSVTFTGWVLYPPNMQTPYRMTVKAPKDGEATLETTSWNKL